PRGAFDRQPGGRVVEELATRQLLACQAADENGPCHCVEEPWKDRGFFGARIGDGRRYNTTKTCPSCGHARQEHIPVTGPSIRKTAQGLPREKGNCPDCWGNGYTYDISRANEPIISGYF